QSSRSNLPRTRVLRKAGFPVQSLAFAGAKKIRLKFTIDVQPPNDASKLTWTASRFFETSRCLQTAQHVSAVVAEQRAHRLAERRLSPWIARNRHSAA